VRRVVGSYPLIMGLFVLLGRVNHLVDRSATHMATILALNLVVAYKLHSTGLYCCCVITGGI
jgi:hypothetical protein